MGTERTLTRAELVGAMRRLAPVPGQLRVACDHTGAILFRDAIELYARLRGATGLVWTDPCGRSSPAAGIVANVGALGRDLAMLPVMVARGHRLARRLRAKASGPKAQGLARGALRRALYLRSDHWFNVGAGGSVGHVKGVIDGLRRCGVEVEVLSSDRLAGIAEDEAFHLCPPRYGPGRNVPGLPELDYGLRMADAVAALVARRRPDFLYQRLSFNDLSGALLRARHGLPYICEYNGSIPWMARHWDRRPVLFERLALDIETTALLAADLVVAVSEASRDELVARGVPAARILVNPNGVDVGVYHPAVDGAPVRARFGLEGRTVIGFIGTFGKWHGAEVLVDAFAAALAGRPDLRDSLRLLLVGDGLMRAEAEARAQTAGVADKVVFAGRVPQAEGPAHLAACDMLVSPHVPNADGSRFFGSPTKLFEYMAAGRPIVASALEQIGSVLEDGRSALLVPPGDVEALAGAMLRLVDDADLGTGLAANARRLAEERYGWDRHADAILDALRARLG